MPLRTPMRTTSGTDGACLRKPLPAPESGLMLPPILPSRGIDRIRTPLDTFAHESRLRRLRRITNTMKRHRSAIWSESRDAGPACQEEDRAGPSRYVLWNGTPTRCNSADLRQDGAKIYAAWSGEQAARRRSKNAATFGGMDVKWTAKSGEASDRGPTT